MPRHPADGARTRLPDLLLIAAAVLLLCAPPASARIQGAVVTRAVPHSAETAEHVRAFAAPGIAPPAGGRTTPRHRVRKPFQSAPSPSMSLSISPVPDHTAPRALPAGSASRLPTAAAPALDTDFRGLTDDATVIPPDTMGAAGPDHLVSLLNSQFAVFDKRAGLIPDTVISIDAFWGSVLPDISGVFPFDPKVVYDHSSGRFIFTSVAGQSAPDSWLLVAVTATSDPGGLTYKWAIDADADADNVVRGNWADFPQMGVDERNVYVSANMFNSAGFFQYTKVWVIPKAQLLAGANPITWIEFRDPPPIGTSTMQPAVTIGRSAAEYFVFEEGTRGTLGLAQITGPAGSPTWKDLGRVNVADYTPFFSPGLPGAPQLGTDNAVDTGDTRLLNAVFRDGFLWTTHNVAGNGTQKTEIAWYKIDPVTMSVVDQGRISDPNRWYYMPSIAVNANGDMAIGFSGSSAGEYASAYYALRRVSDPPGTTSSPTLLKTGVAPYNRPRWGDYSATVVDPADDFTFWTLQEYAAVTSGGRSLWGTWWGKFHPTPLEPPTELRATAESSTRVSLSWRNQSPGQGIRVERKDGPAADFARVALLDNSASSFADNTVTPGSAPRYRLLVFDASGGSYGGEVQVHVPPPPGAGGGGGGGCSAAGAEEPATTAGSAVSLVLPFLLLAARKRRRTGPR